jgi:hypothetical protein
MRNQHAGLSQLLAEQRMTERHEQAARERLVRGIRSSRRRRRYLLTRRWWQWARWPNAAVDQPVDHPRSAS